MLCRQGACIEPLSTSRDKSGWVTQSPVYYGWVILGVGTLGLTMTGPGQTYGVSIFIEHFIGDLGLSRSRVSMLYMIGTMSASIVLPFVGRQIDRWGSRRLIVIIAILFGLACVYMGFVRSAAMLGVGFFTLRLLGQGSLSLVSRIVINQWWVRRRGLANGIVGMGYALIGRATFPLLLNALIPMIGWRETYACLGAALLCGMAPIGWLLVRNRPEEYGLQPDGQSSRRRTRSRYAEQLWSEEHWTLAEVLRTPVFWLMSGGFSSMSLLSTGLTFHIVSIYVDNGLTPTLAAAAFIPMATTSACVQLGSGMLLDRVAVRILLAIALFLHTVILLLAPHLTSVVLAMGFGVIMGAANGLQMTIGSVVWAMYFGRRYLGSIAGATAAISVASSAGGPMLFGIARDMLGSYTLVVTVSAGLPLLMGVANLCFGQRPQRPQA